MDDKVLVTGGRRRKLELRGVEDPTEIHNWPDRLSKIRHSRTISSIAMDSGWVATGNIK